MSAYFEALAAHNDMADPEAGKGGDLKTDRADLRRFHRAVTGKADG